MAATLAEPVVLAAAKDTLYPAHQDCSNQYAVTETQFTQSTWGEWTIPDEVRNRLAPYNSIRLGEGEPDLLGIGMPAGDVLNSGDVTTPVVAIEAKGHNSDPSDAKVKKAISQAHSYLSDVNLGYVAVPMQSITNTKRALAREVNVGIIGVESPFDATLVEPARITGAGDFSKTINAIRFQATTHHLTEGSFPVNHPKNYLGYVLAVAADADTQAIYADKIINSVSGGRRGAILLGLVDDRPEGEALTHQGAEIVRFARTQHGSIHAALDQFDSWTGRSTRFTELAPQWAQLARAVAVQYDPTQLIIEALEQLHGTGTKNATIAEVATEACRINQPLAVEIFFTQNRRDDILTKGGDLNEPMLQDPTVYKSGIHFQYKYQLYHVGLLTTGGTSDKDEVLDNSWQLEQAVSSFN